jgi:predicted transcriptional regulator YdeE
MSFRAAIALFIIVVSLSAAGDTPLNPKMIDQAAFIVVGIAARTANAKEMSGQGVIAHQWGRLFQEGLLNKIPNKADANIIAVYTDYESDSNGAYTFILGAKVNSMDKIPSGMVAHKIPAGKFAVFTTEKGPGSKVVPEAWGRINDPQSAAKLNRAYKADFEIYDQRAIDPQNSQVDIYVGVK